MNGADEPELPFRVLPRVTERNAHFWQGGRDGELRFLHCGDCDTFVHPPAPVCPDCHRKGLGVRAVSGRASVLTFTLNHQPWVPSPDHPYAIAIVEIEEQPGLRLMTNVVGCAAEDVHVGMPVQVAFEEHEDVFIPVFRPRDA
ncbi:MAG: Zn-ribbon domain-containing OB-fold protein [Myxococcota bacterium]